MAAQQYGIQVNRHGMCAYPFHNDKNPSMKVDKRFHCFGCQADGDVIDFTARLFHLTSKEAKELLLSAVSTVAVRMAVCSPSENASDRNLLFSHVRMVLSRRAKITITLMERLAVRRVLADRQRLAIFHVKDNPIDGEQCWGAP